MRTESLAAIDVHVHIEVDGHGHHSMDDELLAASAKYFRADHDRSPTLEQIADRYRSLNSQSRSQCCRRTITLEPSAKSLSFSKRVRSSALRSST